MSNHPTRSLAVTRHWRSASARLGELHRLRWFLRIFPAVVIILSGLGAVWKPEIGPFLLPGVAISFLLLMCLAASTEQVLSDRRRYQDIAEGVDAVLWENDLLGRNPPFVSRRIEALLGFSRERFLEDPDFWERRIHPDDVEGFVQARRQALKGPDDTQELEVRMITADNRTVWVRSRMTFERDASGRVVRLRGAILDVTRFKRYAEELEASLEALKEANEERRAMVARLFLAEEHERQRLATKLHQDSLQILAAMGVHVSLLRHRLRGGEAAEILQALEDSVRLSISGLRELFAESLPHALRNGLPEAVRGLVQKTAQKLGIEANFSADEDLRADTDAEAVIYRIAREALENIARHAAASKVLVFLEAKADGLRLEVSDDGRGFDPDGVKASGLVAMSEWTRLVAGHCRVASIPGQGSVVEVWVPVTVPAAVSTEAARTDKVGA